MADVNTIIEAANAIFMTLAPDIKRVFSEAPDSGPSGDLPCVIPIFESFTHLPQSNGYQRKNYLIKYLLLVSPYNGSLVTIEKRARPFGDRVANAFFPHVKLGLDASSGIDHASLSNGTYGPIAYSDTATYIGWMFVLNATIKTVIDQGF